MARRTFPQTAVTASLALSLTAALALTSACAFKPDDGPTKSGTSAPSPIDQQMDENRPLVLDDFKHEFIPRKNLNEYGVRITWPAGRPFQVKFSQDSKLVKVVDGRTENTFEMECNAGTVRYSVQAVSTLFGITLDRDVTKECPFDLEVTGGISKIEALQTVNGRLVLANGAQIVIGANMLNLNLRELIIRDALTGGSAAATIVTFDRDRKPNWPNHHILVPPSIAIRAQKASGTLFLSLNGVDGPPTRNLPDEEDPTLNGQNGKDGEAGPAQIGGAPCAAEPTDGSPGKPSEKVGRTGENGVRGIGTSSVTLDIADTKDFYVLASMNPGLASEPGLGSQPLGGKGGKAGRKGPSPFCEIFRKAIDGPNGENGTRGNPGNRAPNGACGTISARPELLSKIKIENSNPKLACGDERNLLRPL